MLMRQAELAEERETAAAKAAAAAAVKPEPEAEATAGPEQPEADGNCRRLRYLRCVWLH